MSQLQLNGIIASDDDAPVYEWFGLTAVSPYAVRQAVDEARAADGVLELLINSPGGNVHAGAEMYAILRAAEDIRTCAVVQSLAASAASCVLCGADEAVISPMGLVMVHLPSTCTKGNRNDHMNSVCVLDAVTESILNAYELKCSPKRTRAELRRMTEAETWLSAQEAIDAGFCDRLTDDGSILAAQYSASALPIRPDGLNLSEMRRAYLHANRQKRQNPSVDAIKQARARAIALAQASLGQYPFNR